MCQSQYNEDPHRTRCTPAHIYTKSLYQTNMKPSADFVVKGLLSDQHFCMSVPTALLIHMQMLCVEEYLN